MQKYRSLLDNQLNPIQYDLTHGITEIFKNNSIFYKIQQEFYKAIGYIT
jgi:hypothetical protein